VYGCTRKLSCRRKDDEQLLARAAAWLSNQISGEDPRLRQAAGAVLTLDMKQWDCTVTSNSTTKESALSTTTTQPWRSGKHAPRACCSLPSTTLTDSTAQVSHPPLTPGQSCMSSLSLRPPYIHQLTLLPSASPSGSPHSRPRTRPRSSRMSRS
jgi:hypothetical protein